MTKAFIKALEERQRQINIEGFTADHDDQYQQGELVRAAVAYALAANATENEVESEAFSHWPWSADWWKPSSDPRRNIEKAMALLAAQHDKLGREIDQPLGSLATATPNIVWSTDDVLFNYDDLQDVVENNDLETGATVYHGTTKRLFPPQFTKFMVAHVEDAMNLRAEDVVGDAADKWPKTSFSEKAVLQAFIDAWAETYCPITFHQVINTQPYTIMSSDIGDAK